ncbi:MAG TPA: glycosyltransferase family 4 protein [Terriglobales bacterium]|nr:glycosyltransferase family 4 protein [Terriglobales bacterium]
MKICFVSHSSRLGGAEMVLLETIEVLQESGVGCYAVLPSRGPLLGELEKLHVPTMVRSYPLWVSPERPYLPLRIKTLLSMAAKSALIAWRAWRWDCDIIYSNTATVCVGAFAAVLLGRPHVWHVHESVHKTGFNFIFGSKWSHSVMNRLSALVIAPSQTVAGEINSWLQGAPAQVVYCSLHRALRNDGCVAGRNGRYRCVITGAITENKRQEDAVLALLELRQRQVDVELVVIGEGDGDYGARLQHLVSQNQLQDRVRFLGWLDNPMPQLRAADVALVCSGAEGFGRTTAEAMLAGRPVVGANNTATAELIRDGSNGLLYRTADPHDLACKINHLYCHPEIASGLGRNGQSWAKRAFSRDRYRDEMLPRLNDLLPAAWRVAL